MDKNMQTTISQAVMSWLQKESIPRYQPVSLRDWICCEQVA